MSPRCIKRDNLSLGVDTSIGAPGCCNPRGFLSQLGQDTLNLA
jgi:hypothetical protein